MADRVLGDLHQDGLARGQHRLDLAGLAVLVAERGPVDLAGVQHGVAALADVDERRLHGGQHVLHPAEVDVADQRGLRLAGDVVLDEDLVLEDGDLGEVVALADHHDPVDGLAAGEELGLADDRGAAAAGLAALAAALLLGLEPGRAGDGGDLVLGRAAAADPGDGVVRVVVPVAAARRRRCGGGAGGGARSCPRPGPPSPAGSSACSSSAGRAGLVALAGVTVWPSPVLRRRRPPRRRRRRPEPVCLLALAVLGVLGVLVGLLVGLLGGLLGGRLVGGRGLRLGLGLLLRGPLGRRLLGGGPLRGRLVLGRLVLGHLVLGRDRLGRLGRLGGPAWPRRSCGPVRGRVVTVVSGRLEQHGGGARRDRVALRGLGGGLGRHLDGGVGGLLGGRLLRRGLLRGGLLRGRLLGGLLGRRVGLDGRRGARPGASSWLLPARRRPSWRSPSSWWSSWRRPSWPPSSSRGLLGGLLPAAASAGFRGRGVGSGLVSSSHVLLLRPARCAAGGPTPRPECSEP